MNDDIGKIVSQCLTNPMIQHYYIKRKEMTYDEKQLQERNFSKMIGYCVLFKESDGIEEYMRLTDKRKQIQFLKSRIADKLGIPQSDIASRIEEIIKYAFDNFIVNGYVFHGANSKAVEENMKYGLKVSEPTNEEKMELMHIDSIYKKYGNDNPLGWGTLDIKQGRNGWFYDSSPNSMLYYADSPEWFGEFCGNNIGYAFGLVEEEARHGYANRDYDACLLAIMALIEKNNMNEEDRKEIIDFFNRCWKKFGDTDPALIFVPISSLKDSDYLNRLKSYYFPSLFDEEIIYQNADMIFEDIINGECSMMGNDVCCTINIGAEVLSYVNLSPILPRFKISKDSKKREMTLQDCIAKLQNLDMEYLLKAQEMLSQFPSKDSGRSI